MAMRRLYAVLTSRCGWTLEYVDAMPFQRAVWHAENLENLGNEDGRVHLAIASAVMADRSGWQKILSLFPEPWRTPRRPLRVRYSWEKDGKD